MYVCVCPKAASKLVTYNGKKMKEEYTHTLHISTPIVLQHLVPRSRLLQFLFLRQRTGKEEGSALQKIYPPLVKWAGWNSWESQSCKWTRATQCRSSSMQWTTIKTLPPLHPWELVWNPEILGFHKRLVRNAKIIGIAHLNHLSALALIIVQHQVSSQGSISIFMSSYCATYGCYLTHANPNKITICILIILAFLNMDTLQWSPEKEDNITTLKAILVRLSLLSIIYRKLRCPQKQRLL